MFVSMKGSNDVTAPYAKLMQYDEDLLSEITI